MNIDPYELVLPFAILILTFMLSAKLVYNMQQATTIIPGGF